MRLRWTALLVALVAPCTARAFPGMQAAGTRAAPVAKAARPSGPTTRSPAALRISRAHIVFAPARGAIHITEVVTLQNRGPETYAGAPIVVPLFPGAEGIRASAPPGAELVAQGTTLHHRGRLQPGETTFQVEYHVHPPAELVRATALPIERLFVVVTRGDAKLTGPLFRRVERMTRNGVAFLSTQGGPIAAGGRIELAVEPPAALAGPAPEGGGEAGEAEGAAGKPELVRDWRVVAKWLTPLAAMVLFFAAVWLATRRRDEEEEPLVDEAALSRERARLLAEIAAGRRAQQTRTVLRREKELFRRVAAIYRELDGLAASRALGGAEGRAP